MFHYRHKRSHFSFRRASAWFLLPALLSMQAQARDKQTDPADTSQQIAELTALVRTLQARVDDLEKKLESSGTTGAQAAAPKQSSEALVNKPPASPTAASSGTPGGSELLRGTTVNFLLDGYYGYNFNNPIGRVNILRAYDVSSNSFSLNQADVVLENPADPAHGKRFGLRLDLQFGQATETLQGNAANELRPNVWRNLFQAYGTYVAPVGNGLTIDFGKWASSLGIEGNYTKDQMNYSRSFWFNFLPFYHTGARVIYKFNDALAVNYWITNGTQQTEPFNNFKDQLIGLNLQPHKDVAWTINYYLGQEHPDVRYGADATGSNDPTQQGTPFEPIPNAPKGKLHILDTYLTWQASRRLTLGVEGDYVIQRLNTSSAPARTDGGAAYARFQLTRRTAIAGRTEYLFDHGGMFTGATQTVKETTLTFEQKLADGFLLREEWRRDFSNHPYFLTGTLGSLKKEQTAATIGLVWWFGAKEGGW